MEIKYPPKCMTVEFDLGVLNGTLVRQGNVSFGNRTDTYRFTTTRNVTDFFLQSTTNGAFVDVSLYQDINNNGLIDSGEYVDNRSTNPGDIDYITKNLGRSSYIVEVKSDSQGRAAAYTLRLGNLADAVVGLNSPSTKPVISGSVGLDKPFDIFAFNTAAAGDVELSARGTTAFADVSLYEDINKNRQLDDPDVYLDNRSVNPGDVDLIQRRVGAGDFLIQVSAGSDGRTTQYQLSLSGPAGANLAGGSSGGSGNSTSGTVYRFYDFLTGSHFYTVNQGERDARIADGRYRYEGAAFDSAGANTIERFYNRATQTYFYTINPAERDSVQKIPNFQYEPGLGFKASITPAPGFIPVYRFFNTQTGVHFYTPNPTEAQNVRTTLRSFRDEGVGFYVDPLG